MKASILWLILGFAACALCQSSKSTQCQKNTTAIYIGNRECGNLCLPNRVCKSRQAKCRCDGACGMVCIPDGLTCNAPDEIENGVVLPAKQRHRFSEDISYKCNEGYELIGPTKRTCQGDETWSGKDSFCTLDGVRCERPHFEVQNGYADITGKDNFYLNDVVEYKCLTGYSASKSSKTKTKCNHLKDKEAEWSPAVHVNCIPKRCSSPAIIEDGDHTGSDYSFGQEIVYHCHPGYFMNGRASHFCTSDGTWSGYPPTCEVISCEDPSSPEQGNARFKTTVYRSTVWYSCDEGFQLIGTDHAVCSENGDWSSEAPSCKVIDCGQPPSPDRGKMTYTKTTWNERVDYTCDPGTSSVGMMQSVCALDQDGQPKWSMPPPVCLGDCDTRSVENAVIIPVLEKHYRQNNLKYVNHGSSARMECGIGYEMLTSGSNSKLTVVCHDGAWEPNHECTPKPCPCRMLPTYILGRDHAELVTVCARYSDIPSGESLELQCNPSYPELKLSGSLKCVLGEWEYKSHQCQEKSCDVEPHFEHGVIGIIRADGRIETLKRFRRVEHNTNLLLQCTEEGYELAPQDIYEGKALTVRCNDGSLGKLPTCGEERCNCNNLKISLQKKSVTPKECHNYVRSGTDADLQCATGYSLPSGPMTASCRKGKWSKVRGNCKPMCACWDLATSLPQSLRVSGKCHDQQIESEKSVDLLCRNQHAKSEGSSQIFCKDGKWDKVDFRCYASCMLPPMPHGKYEQFNRRAREDYKLRSVQHDETIIFTCEKNYKLNIPEKQKLDGESHTLVCAYGQLSAVPSCVEASATCVCSDLASSLPAPIRVSGKCDDLKIDSEKSVELICTNEQEKFEGSSAVICRDGEWGKVDFRCYVSPSGCDCKSLAKQLQGTRITADCNNPISHEDVITLTCDTGTTMESGTERIVCAEGRWGFTDMVCKDNPINAEQDGVPATTKEPQPTVTNFPYLHPTTMVSSFTKSNRDNIMDNKEEFSSAISDSPLEAESSESTVLEGLMKPMTTESSDGCIHETCEQPGKDNGSNNGKRCKNVHGSNIIAFYNHQRLTATKRIPAGSSVTYRCPEIGKYSFSGETHRYCTNEGWASSEPKCLRLSSRSTSKAPVIQFTLLGEEHFISEDGAINVPEGADITLSCQWFKMYGNVTWTSNATNTAYVEEWDRDEDDFELRVPRLSNEYSGMYTCTNPYKQHNSVMMQVISKKTNAGTTIASTNIPHKPRPKKEQLPTAATGFTKAPTQENPTPGLLLTNYPKFCLSPLIRDKQIIVTHKGRTIQPNTALHDKELINYKCEDLYLFKLIGNRISQCIDGQWTHDQPFCEKIYKSGSQNEQTQHFNNIHTTLTPMQSKKCIFTPIHQIVAHYRGWQLLKTEHVPHGAIIRYRCDDVFLYDFVGSHSAECKDGEWSGTKPSCTKFIPNSVYRPPPVSLQLYERQLVITEDGTIVVPPLSVHILISCYTQGSPDLIVNKEYSTSAPMLYAADVGNGYFYWQWIKVNLENKAAIEIGCRHPTPYESHYVMQARVITLKVSEVCEVDEVDWGRNHGQMIVLADRRKTYVEGDIIAMNCTYKAHPENSIPEFKKCLRNGSWENSRLTTCENLFKKSF